MNYSPFAVAPKQAGNPMRFLGQGKAPSKYALPGGGVDASGIKRDFGPKPYVPSPQKQADDAMFARMQGESNAIPNQWRQQQTPVHIPGTGQVGIPGDPGYGPGEMPSLSRNAAFYERNQELPASGAPALGGAVVAHNSMGNVMAIPGFTPSAPFQPKYGMSQADAQQRAEGRSNYRTAQAMGVPEDTFPGLVKPSPQVGDSQATINARLQPGGASYDPEYAASVESHRANNAAIMRPPLAPMADRMAMVQANAMLRRGGMAQTPQNVAQTVLMNRMAGSNAPANENDRMLAGVMSGLMPATAYEAGQRRVGQIGVADSTGAAQRDVATINDRGLTTRTGMTESGLNTRTGLTETGLNTRLGLTESGLNTRSAGDRATAERLEGMRADVMRANSRNSLMGALMGPAMGKMTFGGPDEILTTAGSMADRVQGKPTTVPGGGPTEPTVPTTTTPRPMLNPEKRKVETKDAVDYAIRNNEKPDGTIDQAGFERDMLSMGVSKEDVAKQDASEQPGFFGKYVFPTRPEDYGDWFSKPLVGAETPAETKTRKLRESVMRRMAGVEE